MTKVWHISRFRERFELPEDVRLDRKTPLHYTKDFVGSGNDDESCNYYNQLMALRSNRSRSSYHKLKGILSDLKSIAGNKSKEYRGYLLDSNFKPASVKEIGRWLGYREKEAEKILQALKDVGLIEHVGMPKFNGSPEKSGRARARPGKTVKRRKPLKRKTNGKAKVKEKEKKRHKVKPQKKVPTPTTQPIKPQPSAKAGRVVQSAAPPELKNTDLLGDVARRMLHRYDPRAKQFALEIYRALKLTWDLNSEQGKRELGCFSSLWHSADGSDELWARAVSEAEKIAKRRQNIKKGAVFCTVFKKLEAAYARRKIKEKNYVENAKAS